MADEAVSNSGPLIHLAQIRRFNLLSVFNKIFVPHAVYDEVCIAGKPGNIELNNAGFISTCDVSNNDIEAISKHLEITLDDGEIHALALCMKISKKIFLTDDMDAREAGTILGFEVHGSVGVIARAYRHGLVGLTEAKTAMDDLYNISDLFIAKAIIDDVKEEIQKY